MTRGENRTVGLTEPRVELATSWSRIQRVKSKYLRLDSKISCKQDAWTDRRTDALVHSRTDGRPENKTNSIGGKCIINRNGKAKRWNKESESV